MSRSSKPFKKRLDFDQALDLSTSVSDSISVIGGNLSGNDGRVSVSTMETFQCPEDEIKIEQDIDEILSEFKTPERKFTG